MAFVLIGLALLLLRLLEIGPTGLWPWWAVLLPFGLALAWWAWSDATGLTRRKEMDKMDERKAERRRKHIEALGLPDPRKRQPGQQRAKPKAPTKPKP